MRRRTVPDEWKYGNLSSEEVRSTLLKLVLAFVVEARRVTGVERIALVGSLTTKKEYPKDADVLVTITRDIRFDRLARIGRRLKGRSQGINSGADVFLANSDGDYIGRVCHYKECFRRVACLARHCGAHPHLNDDLDFVMISAELIATPPILLFPILSAVVDVPADVESILVSALRTGPARYDCRPKSVPQSIIPPVQ